ncbi:MAG: hypothetical protein GY749_16910 [Desulfobacteraceae bacterium]|nr:hypothetical protein [Desulfobacteraceae bacterium]
MKLIEKIIDKIDDNLNPILVREMRQAVQNHFIFSLLAVLLIALLAVMSYFVLFSTSQGYVILGRFVITGHRMFMILLVFFVCSSVIFVPAYLGSRAFKERFENNTELIFISALGPGAILRGKLFVGIIMTFLIFSVCLPFMTFTYLLSGINLLSVFVIVIMTFIVVIILTHAFCIPLRSGHEKPDIITFISQGVGVAINFVFLCLAGVVFCSMTILPAIFILKNGIGSTATSWIFWTDATLVFILAALSIGGPYVNSVTAMLPPSANRSLGTRLYISAAWLATGVISFIRTCHFKSFEVKIWFILYVVVMGVKLLTSACEKDGQSPRVAHTIPYGKIKRTAAFFFYNGAANGIAFSLAMAGLTFFAVFFGQMFINPIFVSHADILYTAFVLFLYNYCFTISGLLIRRKFLWKPEPETPP